MMLGGIIIGCDIVHFGIWQRLLLMSPSHVSSHFWFEFEESGVFMHVQLKSLTRVPVSA